MRLRVLWQERSWPRNIMRQQVRTCFGIPAPAAIWDQALPIGNGRLGAMVFGGANSGDNNGDLQSSRQNAALLDGSHTSGADEHLQLNESSLWNGSRADRLNPAAHAAVARDSQASPPIRWS